MLIVYYLLLVCRLIETRGDEPWSSGSSSDQAIRLSRYNEQTDVLFQDDLI